MKKKFRLTIISNPDAIYFGRQFMTLFILMCMTYEPPCGKTNNVISEQVRHKPACTSTEKSWKLEISDLSRRGIVLSE